MMKVDKNHVTAINSYVEGHRHEVLERVARLLNYLGDGDLSEPPSKEVLMDVAGVAEGFCLVFATADWARMTKHEVDVGLGDNNRVIESLQDRSTTMAAVLGGICDGGRVADAMTIAYSAAIANIVRQGKQGIARHKTVEELCTGAPEALDNFMDGDVNTGKGLLATALHNLDDQGITLPAAAVADLDSLFAQDIDPEKADALLHDLASHLGFSPAQIPA